MVPKKSLCITGTRTALSAQCKSMSATRVTTTNCSNEGSREVAHASEASTLQEPSLPSQWYLPKTPLVLQLANNTHSEKVLRVRQANMHGTLQKQSIAQLNSMACTRIQSFICKIKRPCSMRNTKIEHLNTRDLHEDTKPRVPLDHTVKLLLTIMRPLL